MALTLKSLLMLLATSALCYGERKSEKREISDFGSGFSTSKLEGSGIKISTDFGKEITLEEYKQNGYTFINEGNNPDASTFNYALKDSHGNYDFTKDLENEQQVLANNGIPSNLNNAQNLNQVLNEHQIAMLNAALQNQGSNNRDTSSVSYITQNIPVPVPHPYQINIDRQVPIPVPQPIQINVPKPVQQYPIQITKPYHFYVNRHVPVNIPHPVPVPERQEYNIPISQPYPAHVAQQYSVSSVMSVASDENNNENQETYSADQEKSVGDDRNVENSIQSTQNQQIQALPTQNAKQVVSHESETTSNKGFMPSSFQMAKGPGLFTPNNRQKVQPPTQEEIFKNLQNIQNQAILAGQAHNQAVLSGLSQHQESILSGLAQNLQAIRQSTQSGNQKLNFPSFNLQMPEDFSALFNGRQGHVMNLQQNGNTGHSFGSSGPQNSQTMQQQYPANGQNVQAANLQSAAQTQVGEYNVAGVQPQNIQQILSHSRNHASAQQIHNAKM